MLALLIGPRQDIERSLLQWSVHPSWIPKEAFPFPQTGLLYAEENATVFWSRKGSYRFDSTPITPASVPMKASSQGCRPPLQGKRAQYSTSTDDGVHALGFIPGRAGRSWGRSMNHPKVFTAKAAELSGLANLPLSSSWPPAFERRSRTCFSGTPGRNRFIGQLGLPESHDLIVARNAASMRAPLREKGRQANISSASSSWVRSLPSDFTHS